MYRGTTPTLRLTVNGNNPENFDKYTVILRQGDVVIMKDETQCHFEDSKILVPLTEEDTFKFDGHGKVNIQLEFLLGDYKGSSDIVLLPVKQVIGEVTYGN